MGTLYREVAGQRRDVLHDLGIPRHQEIDDDVDRRAVVHGRHLPHQLKAPERPALFVAMLSQCIDQRRILAVAQCLGIQSEIDVHGADMRHIVGLPQ